jgi:carboxyl-terminal processing protease
MAFRLPSMLPTLLGGAILYTSVTAEVPLETTFQMKAEIKDMRMAMERLHYSGKQIQEVDFEQLISDYMARLDFNYLYFLKSDEELWRQRFGRTLKNTYLDKNELYPAFYIFNQFESRVADRIAWIDQYLAGDVDLFTPETYIYDQEDATWVNTTQELEQQWGLRLRNEIMAEIVPKVRDKLDAHFGKNQVPAIDLSLVETVAGAESISEWVVEAKEKIGKRYERWAQRISEMKQAEVQEGFLTQMAQIYDPHSNFMSPDTSEEFGISISNELIGIGAVLADENGYCIIRELVDSGPAAKSGELGSGDTIIGVAQGKNDFEDVVGKRLRDIVRLIRGKEDSVVRLKVLPSKGPRDEKVVTIIRKRIKLEEKLASAEIHQVPVEGREVPIGVITLPNFYGPTSGNPHSTRASEDVHHLILKLKDRGAEGLILDLRNNGGGLLEEAINVTGLFISTGPVVKVKNRSGDIEISRDYDPRISWEGPLAVLTSRYSASASEIVAGALQYYKRALVIGDESTHGKGTVQTTFSLPISVYDLYGSENSFVRPTFLDRVGRLIPTQTNRSGTPSMAKITIAKYYLPDGSSTQIRGVVADIPLPSVSELLPIRESDLTNPLPWDQIDGYALDTERLLANSYPYLQSNIISALNERSKERQQSLDEFQYLNESIISFKERFDRKAIPIDLISRLNLIYQDENRKRILEESSEALNQYAFESVRIPLKDIPLEEEVPAVAALSNAVGMPDESMLNTDGTDEVSEESPRESEPGIDIHLRESIRIVGDWIELERYLNATIEERQIALNSLDETLKDVRFWDHLNTRHELPMAN